MPVWSGESAMDRVRQATFQGGILPGPATIGELEFGQILGEVLETRELNEILAEMDFQ